MQLNEAQVEGVAGALTVGAEGAEGEGAEEAFRLAGMLQRVAAEYGDVLVAVGGVGSVGGFAMTVALGNAEMMSPDDLAEAMRWVANEVQSGRAEAPIHDRNGNTVGSFTIGLPRRARDATPAELEEESDLVIKLLAAGEMGVTTETQRLAQEELERRRGR